MGRKIPSKKHRGVKDPLQQQARRLHMLKTKINAPPTDPDEQPVPRSLTELFARAAPRPAARKRTPAPSIKKESKGNPISQLRKLPGESSRGFSLRINNAIRTLHDCEEAQDYPQDSEEADARGERMAAQRERRRRKRKEDAPAPRAARRDRLREKKTAAAEAALAAQRERPQYERVPFGEVTAAPPALPRMRGAADAAPRPGRRDLLLSKMLSSSGASAASVPSAANAADRERRERARLDAVAAYRALKKQKRKQ